MATSAAADRYADLERLASLHDEGILSDAEFDAEKSAVLGLAPIEPVVTGLGSVDRFGNPADVVAKWGRQDSNLRPRA